MSEEIPLRVARMATITKKSFWIFIVTCMALYIINKIITPDKLDGLMVPANDSYILAAAFTGLFLNLIADFIANELIKRAFNIACYIFEIVSIIILIFLVFSK